MQLPLGVPRGHGRVGTDHPGVPLARVEPAGRDDHLRLQRSGGVGDLPGQRVGDEADLAGVRDGAPVVSGVLLGEHGEGVEPGHGVPEHPGLPARPEPGLELGVVLAHDHEPARREPGGGQVQRRTGGEQDAGGEGPQLAPEQHVGQQAHPGLPRPWPEQGRPLRQQARHRGGVRRVSCRTLTRTRGSMREPRLRPAAEQRDQLDVAVPGEMVRQVDHGARDAAAAVGVEQQHVHRARGGAGSPVLMAPVSPYSEASP